MGSAASLSSRAGETPRKVTGEARYFSVAWTRWLASDLVTAMQFDYGLSE